MTPKGVETMRRSLYAAAVKRTDEMDQDAARAASMAQDMDRFLELQGTDGLTMQGPIAGRVLPLSDAAQEMDSITERITPKMREPGSGPMSDSDVRMFRISTVGRTKDAPVNKAIADGVKANAQIQQDRAQFMRDYLSVNGHLDGADRQWKRYLEANPIFDRNSRAPKLNPTRVPYQQFFGTSAPVAPSAGGGLSPQEKAELEALRKRFPGGGQ
jgi:hypothetical protein